MNRNLFFIIWINVITLVLLVLNGCGGRKEPILARLDEEVITLSQFNERISKLPAQYQELAKKAKVKLLDDFIVELLCYKEAIRLGIDRQKDTKEVLRAAKRKILMAKFIEEEVEKKIKVEEAEIRDYYEKHKDYFLVPETYKASHILVNTEEKAKALLNKLSEGADFGELAKAESMDLTNRRGGDVGYFKKGQLVPEFEEACLKLEIGQVSPIVKTSFGYHIIKLTDKRPAGVRRFEEVRNEIKTKIKSMKRKERFNHITQKLKDKANIQIDYDLIKSK